VDTPRDATLAHESSGTHTGPTAATYLLVWVLLVLLTALTVGVSYVDMKRLAVVAALVIATAKACLVVLYFMHVRYEPRLVAIMVAVGLAALAVFLGLTFTDILYRY
jgi:cytochrome c oxidase subunit 4